MNKHRLLKSGIFWIAVFLIIQTIACLLIAFGNKQAFFLYNFPIWLIQFILLELVFSAALYAFIKCYWSNSEECSKS